MSIWRISVPTLCLAAGVAVGADQAGQDPAPVPEPPPVPDHVPQEEGIKPEVTIIRKPDQVIEEYRINGELYKVKVIPKRGKPYYLMYPQGAEGRAIRRDLENIQTPYWLIFSW